MMLAPAYLCDGLPHQCSDEDKLEFGVGVVHACEIQFENMKDLGFVLYLYAKSILEPEKRGFCNIWICKI